MAAAPHASNIFAPYRALGYCCNHVPLSLFARGDSILVATAIGRTHHVYNCNKLHLIYVGDQEPSDITSLVIDKKRVFTAAGNTIRAWKKGKCVGVYEGHTQPITNMMVFADHLISVDEEDNVFIWAIQTREVYGQLQFDPKSFHVLCLMHPSTYLNKVLFGSKQGQLQLWNLHTSKLIYTFKGWNSPVLALEQSTVIDVVAIGLENGSCLLHNLKMDETLMKFHQEWGPVTAVSFRLDGIATMATASTVGEIAIWDLDRRCLATIIQNAHEGAVAGLQFIPSQPLLLTSGPDNAIKMWIFDQSDGSGRLLKSRSGHGAPPTKVRFCTKGGQGILSSGLDHTLRIFTTVKDSSAVELSQGSVVREARLKGVRAADLKLPTVVDFAVENTRADDWDSIVTCHAGRDSNRAHTWHLHKRCIGKHSLMSKYVDQGARPVCCCITSCGNFTILGTSTGHIEMFNMQSGLHRGVFGKGRAHDKTIRGLAVDGLNDRVFSGSADSTVKTWSFRDKTCLGTISLESPVAVLCLHRESSLLAVATDDFTVLLIDTDTQRIVRIFKGHSSRITDLAFSSDSHWLISSSIDCSIRTWDLPSGRLIDVFLVESPATSVHLSPVGEYLVTTHIDNIGIYLWSNMTLYGPVPLKPVTLTHSPLKVGLPSTKLTEIQESGDAAAPRDEGDEGPSDGDGGVTVGGNQLESGLLTLSNLPKSHWASLPRLELIKERNKPKEPPKVPKAAPFFLPTKPGLNLQFVPTEEIPPSKVGGSKILKLDSTALSSEFQKCLMECHSKGSYESLMDLMKKMSPSKIDAEIHSLSPLVGGSVVMVTYMMEFLLDRLQTRRDFELVQSYMSVILKVHSNLIMETQSLVDLAREILKEQNECWGDLQKDLNSSACLLNYFKSTST